MTSNPTFRKTPMDLNGHPPGNRRKSQESRSGGTTTLLERVKLSQWTTMLFLGKGGETDQN